MLDKKKWNLETFAKKTDFNPMTSARLRNDPNYQPSLRTVVTVCVAFGLKRKESDRLLALAGFVLVPTRRLHDAYAYLIERYAGRRIDECNELLEELGFTQKDFLGSQYREDRKKFEI